MGILNRLQGITELASEHGEMVDHVMEFVNWFMLILFIGWTVFLGIAVYRFRAKKHPRANYHGVRNHASTHIEVAVILTEVVLLLGFAYPLWGRRVDEFPPGEDVLKVRAVGEQFRWIFHYAGEDGKFGRVDPELMSATELIGLDHSDPNGKDDFTSVQELVLATNRRVIIGVTSKDVIHSLAMHPMRMTQDAIPGIEQHVWFVPQKRGTWDIVCAQLCGANHANMRATLEVKSETDFDAWFKEKAPVPPSGAVPPAAPTGSAPVVPAPATTPPSPQASPAPQTPPQAAPIPALSTPPQAAQPPLVVPAGVAPAAPSSAAPPQARPAQPAPNR
ncbi:MAG: cytochrome c oxidase subunit II [Verrucomicrobiales bacterium]